MLKMKMLLTLLICLFLGKDDGWSLLIDVKFESEYFKAQNAYFLVPKFGPELKSKEGTFIELEGYYMPMDMSGNTFIISKFPYSSCFFCGGAGPESIAEVTMKNKPPKLKVDQVIRVRGKLKLNATDPDHMCFQLLESALVL